MKRSLLLTTGLIALIAAPLTAQTRLDDIIVSANRTPTEAARVGSAVTVVTREELDRSGDIALIDYLKRIPGVNIVRNGGVGAAANIRIRGAQDRYVAVYIDGVELSDPSELQIQAELSGLTTADIEQVEVLKGSQSLLYGGEAVGGVLFITTRRATQDGVSAAYSVEAGSYNTVDANGRVSGVFGDSDVSLSFGRLVSDGFSAADENLGNTETDGYARNAVRLKAGHQVSSGIAVSGSVAAETGRGGYDGGTPVADRDNVFERFKREIGAHLDLQNEDSAFTHRIGVQNLVATRDFYTNSAFSFGNAGARDKVEYVGTYAGDGPIDAVFGFDRTWEEAQPVGRAFTNSRIDGLFAQGSFDVGASTLTFGARVDDHSAFGSFETYRATIAYRISDTTKLRSSAATGFRAPSLNELFGPFGANAALKPEESLSLDAGIDTQVAGVDLSATLFRLDIDNRIEFVGGGYNQVAGTSKSTGVEISAGSQIGAVSYGLGYTYSHARNANGTQQVRVPEQEVSLTLATRIGERIGLAADAYQPIDVIDGGRDLGGYVLVNTKLTYDLNADTALHLRIENLLDQEYQTLNRYGTSDRAFYVGVSGQF
ncbi:vitamin B12 transporter [Rubricella aquisinus]|uniref:Vitamin B12 transporter n=1 Tax=Rubricella aquisinus TaxID=2028108 RepID=A0A840X3A4_9RHOB|nr:TonB-dependent receptor [Rubricella aquisinus]MBB5516306.1 vitamin B12 transporter [Rubricella aquisinus]